MRPIFVLIVLLFVQGSLSAETFFLTEKNLLKEMEQSPNIDRIELAYLDREIDYRTTLDDYTLTLDGELQETRSNEEPINDISFVQRRNSFRSLGVTQPLPYGITVGAEYAGNSSGTVGFGDSAQSKLVGKLKVDLFRNFLGRTTYSELKDRSLGVEAAKLSRKIDREVFKLQLLRLYWDYLAAHESQLISERMLESDRKELSLAKEKRKVDAADDGDVARLASQVMERTSQRLSFEATKKQLEAEFRELLPQLKNYDFAMGKYNKKTKVDQFYACLEVIDKEKKTPLQYTLFDELVELKRGQFGYRKKAIDAIADIDLTLDAEAGFVGTDFDRGGSFEDINDDRDTQAAVGLRLSVPLDSKRRNTEEAEFLRAEREFRAESRELYAQLDSFHETIIDAIELIRGIIANRLSNSKKLSVALEDSRTKYRQARITSQQLLQEQDRYFSNELEVISTQRNLIQVMLDYFALFTDTPCDLWEVQS